MIFLRCMHTSDGRRLVTFERLAEELGYADRRNVHNFWMEFERCGGDLEGFLLRQKKVDGEVVARCESIWQAHPLWSATQVYEEYSQRWPESSAGLTAANIRTAGHQISFLKIQQSLRGQLQEGSVCYREAVLFDQLFELAGAGAESQAKKAGTTSPLPEILETISPQGTTPDLGDGPPRRLVKGAETSLLAGDTSPSALAALWEGTTGWLMLMFVLYYHGLSLSVLGTLFGVHKTTVMRWLSPLAQVDWQGVVQQGKRFFSGRVAVDEKWVKIQGKWWYLFVAVDAVSGFPLHAKVLPSNAGEYCRLFLLQLKALGYQPKVVITDGWDAYVKAMADVFPRAQHLLCRFHALHAAFRRLRKQVTDWKERQRWVTPLKTLFHTPSKRTVRRRMDKLQTQAKGTPAEGVITRLVAKLPKLLPAVGSTCRPSTSNAAERFLGAFDRFYQAKGPFQSRASAEKHLALFLLGYVFETYSVEASAVHQGRCPLQVAGYSVKTIPLFHLLNRPNLAPLRKRLVEGYAHAA
jgi:transposase-like protein